MPLIAQTMHENGDVWEVIVAVHNEAVRLPHINHDSSQTMAVPT